MSQQAQSSKRMQRVYLDYCFLIELVEEIELCIVYIIDEDIVRICSHYNYVIIKTPTPNIINVVT